MQQTTPFTLFNVRRRVNYNSLPYRIRTHCIMAELMNSCKAVCVSTQLVLETKEFQSSCSSCMSLLASEVRSNCKLDVVTYVHT